MKIEVNGQQIDTFDDKAKVKISVLDITNPTARKAYKTEQIKIPASERNRAIIGEYENVNAIVNSDLTAKYSDGVVSFSGSLIIYDAVINRNNGYYNIQIVSGNGSWAELMTGKSLIDYDFSGLNHDYTKENIKSSWNGLYNDYIYPVTDYGKFHGVAPVGTLINENVGVHDLLPAVNVRHILDTIFNAEGFTVDDNTTEELGEYYLMSKDPNIYNQDDANNAKFNVKGYQDEIYSQNIEAGNILEPIDLRLNGLFSGEQLNGTNIAFNETDFDNGNNYSAFYRKYVVPKEGTYEFYCNILTSFDFPTRLDFSDDIKITISICINNNPVNSYTNGLTSTGGGRNVRFQIKDKARHLITGDEVTISVSVSPINITNTYHEDIPIYIKIVDSSYFSVETLTRPGINHSWTYDQFLPNLNVLDFLRSIFHLFNIVVITDPALRVVRLYNYNGFYLSIPFFNPELDRSKEISIKMPSTPPYTSRVGYAIDSNDDGITNQQVLFTMNNGSDDETLNNKIFANTLIGNSNQIGYNVPVLHNNGTILQTSPYILPSQTFDFVNRLIHYSNTDSHTWILDREAQTEIPVFDTTGIDIDSLKEQYRRFQYQRNNGKILTGYCDINGVDVANIINNVTAKNIRGRVNVDNVHYVFNTIEYTEKQTTKVELLRYNPVSTGVTVEVVDVEDAQTSSGGGSSSGTSSGTVTQQTGLLLTAGDGEQYTIEYENGNFGINYCINQTTGLNEIYIIHSVTSTQAVISTLAACEISWRA